jgi:hypothetical protein
MWKIESRDNKINGLKEVKLGQKSKNKIWKFYIKTEKYEKDNKEIYAELN